MLDVQVIEIRDILRITNASIVTGVLPKSLRIKGQDFHNAYEVFINEVKSPDVIIISGKELLAQIPTSQTTVGIRTVVVISNRLTRTDRSRITFRFGDSPKSVAGLERLIQLFLKILLQTPGTDIFSPKLGGGVLKAAGRIGGSVSNSASTVAADLQLGVTRTTKQVVSLQANDPAIEFTERLLFAKLLKANFVPSEQALVGNIHIGNQAGQASAVGLVV